MDLTDFNRRWLQAWTDKDVPRLLGFYSPDTRYFDPQVPQGLEGHEALGAYLTGLFAATPPMTYNPEAVWPAEGGYCGRWYCVVGADPNAAPAIRGFDFVQLRGDVITFNEVYTHTLAGAAG
jgi:hypothetical protein